MLFPVKKSITRLSIEDGRDYNLRWRTSFPILRKGVMSMPSRDEIFEKVQSALVDALGVDDDEVTPEATMVGDLGAESIDFLDIVFSIREGFRYQDSEKRTVSRGCFVEHRICR